MAAEPNHEDDCPEAELADLANVFADDDLVELLRAGRHDVDPPTHADLRALGVERQRVAPSDDLVALLSDWRADVLSAPIPAVEPSLAQIQPAVAPTTLPGLRTSFHRFSMRSAFAVAAALVGLLLGSTVVSAREAQPGDLLFGVTSLVWPQEAAEAVARLDFMGNLRAAESALDAGSMADAEAALLCAERALDAAGAANRSEMDAQLDDVKSQLTHPSVATQAGDNGHNESRPPAAPLDEVTAVPVVAPSTAQTAPPQEAESVAVSAPTVEEQAPFADETVSSDVELTSQVSTESTTGGTETPGPGATTPESSAPATSTSGQTTGPTTTERSSTGAETLTSAATTAGMPSKSGTAVATTVRTTG